MTTDMTEGKIIPQLTAFTIPLVLGNLFQLTYNAADSVIVGKFVGDEALAAVGTAGPVMNMIILFISGMCMGAGILMSTQYGAKKYDQLERQISTWEGWCFLRLSPCSLLFLPIRSSGFCRCRMTSSIRLRYICGLYSWV